MAQTHYQPSSPNAALRLPKAGRNFSRCGCFSLATGALRSSCPQTVCLTFVYKSWRRRALGTRNAAVLLRSKRKSSKVRGTGVFLSSMASWHGKQCATGCEFASLNSFVLDASIGGLNGDEIDAKKPGSGKLSKTRQLLQTRSVGNCLKGSCASRENGLRNLFGEWYGWDGYVRVMEMSVHHSTPEGSLKQVEQATAVKQYFLGASAFR